jgi:murein DD-endopeptidase MepM/ murein hydrolase activator NlpD
MVNKPQQIIFSVLIVIALLMPLERVRAQDNPSAGPVYIVQEGDNLWNIAYRFHVSQIDLANVNGIVDPNQIRIGQQLVIPGLEGIEGILTTENVSFGETLHSLGQKYNLSTDMLKRLNHLTSPNELFVGYSLVILQNDHPASLGERLILRPGQSLFELAVLNDTSPWTILAKNQADASLSLLPGEIIRGIGEDDIGPGSLPADISDVNISGLIQGQTAELQITGTEGTSVTGSLMDHNLNFFTVTDSSQVALQGVHAMAQPGLYPLSLTINRPDGANFNFSQNVLVYAGDFLYDQPLSVDPETLNPETTVPEDAQWMSLASQVSPDVLWQGVFSLPVQPVFAECYASRFGSRRSYNGSEYIYFHTGIDYCGQLGDPIYAAASGIVVFTGPLTVRGIATMIDHGQGVFTAYMHQSEILVNVGDRVEQGQLIGRVGNTGRVEGPHLHFEVLVGGVQVDPLEWLNQTFP